ncbi:MAG TPA: type IV pili methyl-accepting chemotaxis transducer N-terminal domain-containing protein [Polyangiaceae bacterium]|nr:type IV pili methyl-accepting chemotaxis transducer N-terminal domain-containing protein [Polyangiaceae bacterium]
MPRTPVRKALGSSLVVMLDQAESPGRSLTIRYILALTSVALLSIGGQVLVQLSLARQHSDAHLVNIAGRQRMLSQKLTKSALALLVAEDTVAPSARLNELRTTLELWERSHLGLQLGDAALELPGQNSHTVAVMFAGLEAPHQKMAAAVRATLANPSEAQERDSARVLLDSEPAFLKGMDAIVFQYDAEANARVTQLKHVELALMLLTLLILAVEGLFVFRPAVTQLRRVIEDLWQTEDELRREKAIAERRLRTQPTPVAIPRRLERQPVRF